MKLFLIIMLSTFISRPCEFGHAKCCQPDEHFNYRLKCVQNAKHNESLSDRAFEFDDIDMFNNFSYFGKIPCGGRLFQIKLVENTEIFEDGRIEIFDARTNKSVIYSVDSFCAELWIISPEESERIVYLCPCLEYTCARKCCEPGSHIRSGPDPRGSAREGGDSCVPQEAGERDWAPEYPAGTGGRYRALLHGAVECGDRHRLHTIGAHRLLDDGSVESESDGLIAPGDHCGDYWLRGGAARVRTVVACVPRTRLRVTLYAAGALGASAALALALLALALRPEAGGRSGALTAHIACLAVANFATGLNHLPLRPDRNIICLCLGYVMHLSYLSAFLWLTVLCAEMGRSFSGVRGAPGARGRRGVRWQGLAAWGAAGALGLMALAADLSPVLPRDSPFRPNVGYSKCWFESWQSLWTFFYGPISLLLGTNLILFAFTSWRVVVLGRGRAVLRREGEEAEGTRYIIFLKMFTLMGVLWLAELISAWVGGPAELWYFTDLLNLLRAIFLLLIVLRKPLRSWRRAPATSGTLTTSVRSDRDGPATARRS